MKKMYFIFFMVLGLCAQASADDFTPYVGFSAQMRSLGFKKDYGHGIFARTLPQGELFAGLKVNPYWGLELGCLRSTERHRTATLHSPGMAFFGPVLLPGQYETGVTSSRVEGFNASAVGFFPLDDETQILGSVGIARLRIKLRYIPISDHNGPLPADLASEATRNFVWSKYVPQAKVGMQRMLTSTVALKAFVGWEGTKRFNLLSPKEGAGDRVSLKDSYNLGLGLTYYFN